MQLIEDAGTVWRRGGGETTSGFHPNEFTSVGWRWWKKGQPPAVSPSLIPHHAAPHAQL